MTDLTRRSAITLSVASSTGMGFPLGGEIDPAMVGINIRLAWNKPEPANILAQDEPYQWCVFLPDWENQSPYWRPGMAVKGKWIALKKYLETLETEFKLV